MTVESDIFQALKGLAADRVFPDFAPIATAQPYVTYTQVGGESVAYLENALPSKKNGRFQVNVWGSTRASCVALMKQVEAALVAATAFQARPTSEPTSSYDHDSMIYSSLQDFSIWSNR